MPYVERISGSVVGIYSHENSAFGAMEWLEDNDPEVVAFLTPSLIPTFVTPAQAKIILFEESLLDTVEVLIEQHPYRPIKIWWEYASIFERGHPYLNAMALELGLTDEQVDVLFIQASQK